MGQWVLRMNVVCQVCTRIATVVQGLSSFFADVNASVLADATVSAIFHLRLTRGLPFFPNHQTYNDHVSCVTPCILTEREHWRCSQRVRWIGRECL